MWDSEGSDRRGDATLDASSCCGRPVEWVMEDVTKSLIGKVLAVEEIEIKVEAEVEADDGVRDPSELDRIACTWSVVVAPVIAPFVAPVTDASSGLFRLCRSAPSQPNARGTSPSSSCPSSSSSSASLLSLDTSTFGKHRARNLL
jgi:hypothetical protein